MAAWQKEAGVVTGRLFDAAGFLGKLKAWIVKVPASGGPGWFIIDDQSAIGANAYIVVSDKNYPYTNANKHKILVFQVSSTAGQVSCLAYRHWNSTTHTTLDTSAWAAYILRVPDTGSSYDFRGGPEGICITSRDGSTIDTCLIDEYTGPDDTILLEPESKTGTVQSASLVETGDNNNQVGSYNLLTGYGDNLDSNGKLYFSVVVSGANSIINIYKDSARTQLIGHTANAATITNTTVTADNLSGLGGLIGRTAVVANDTDIEVDFSLYLDTGEGANFTVGNYYYLFDFNGINKINYCKVRFVSGDRIVVNYTGTTAVQIGAMISPYPHRFGMAGTNSIFSSNSEIRIPYFSLTGFEAPTALSTSQWAAGVAGNGLYLVSNPDDLNYYRATELLIYESQANSGSSFGRRSYGVFKHFFISSRTGMAVFVDGRTFDNGLDYFAVNYPSTSLINGSEAWMIQDTTSLS